MTDFFALLNEPRRPWLEPDSLKEKFLAISAEVHPDRVHSASDSEKLDAQQRYTELNSAYHRLRDPKDRLQHLLELELGAKPQQVQTIPADLMNLSMHVGQLCRETDSFLAEKARTSSPLLQVQLFERAQECIEKLSSMQQRINSQQAALLAELKAVDARWAESDRSDSAQHAPLLRRLEELYHLFGYFSRWQNQLQERIVQLSF